MIVLLYEPPKNRKKCTTIMLCKLMKNEKVKEYRFWFNTNLPLSEIGSLLLNQGVISDYNYDYENVYEWIVGQTDNINIDLNISRKHNDDGDISYEPTTALVMYSGKEPTNKFVERIATIFARKLQVEISLGTMEYLGGDDYKYNEENRITV